MTQALLNNLTNNTQTFLSQLNDKTFVDSKNQLADTSNTFDKSFSKAIDKENCIQKDETKTNVDSEITTDTNNKTLGDLKSAVKSTFSEFSNLLKEVTQEIQNENSLNLTLEKDIAETIENLEIDTEEIDSIETSEITQATETTETVEENGIVNDITNAINSVVNTITEPILKSVDKISSEQNIDFETEEELTVTLNGQDINTVLEDFGVQNLEVETPVVKTAYKSETTESEGKTLEELVDEETLKELNIESVEAETSSSGNDSNLMDNQSAEEQGIKAMLHVDADFQDFNIETKSTQNISTETTKTTDSINPSKILDQISKQLEGLNSGSRVNIVLNPESLGKVSVQLINTKEGLSAQFTCATQEARNLIMKGLDGLKESLLSQGVNVDNVSVKLNESQETEYNADWTEQEGSNGGNKGNRDSQRESKDKKEKFEQMMSFVQEENGNI